jgi:hypothetical protein
MAQTVAHLTPRTPDATTETFDPERLTEQTAPYFRASPLSLLHPDLAPEMAWLYAAAGFTPAEVLGLPGDKTFNAEVAGVMAIREASRPG